jgi:opacity protein-like surface antigen
LNIEGGYMYKYKLLIVLLTLFISPVTLAQDDSTKTEKDWSWDWEWDDWTNEFGFDKVHPAISFQYGFAKIKRDDIQSVFVEPNLIELKLGYIKNGIAWGSDYIIKHNYKFLYLSNESNKLSGKEALGAEIESNMWRFGFGRSGGYGYKLVESSTLILCYSYTLNWSNIDFKYPDIRTFAPDPDTDVLNLYDESFRFGTSSEAGIRIKVIDNLMLDAGYERSIVFQRHLFWKWAGSVIIESAAQGLLDGFINEIFKSSPAAGPVVYFLLKNALAYGIYELRQDKMNWPFNGEAPIAYDQFKFGVTLVF